MGPKGRVAPQKSSGSIAKKKPEVKADGSATKSRKPKAKTNRDQEDDDALIESLISCAAGRDKTTKPEEREDDLDLDFVAALAAETCLTSQHGGDNRCDSVPRPFCAKRYAGCV